MTENSSAVGNASHRRELSKIASKNGADFGQLGNAAKLREALELCVKQMSDVICDKDFGDDVVYLVGCMKTCIEYMKAVLAAPPRNCDVGTAEEQMFRFRNGWERANGERAPQVGLRLASQFSRWAQLLYKEGGVK